MTKRLSTKCTMFLFVACVFHAICGLALADLSDVVRLENIFKYHNVMNPTIEARMQTGNIAGLSITIMDQYGSIMEKGFGYADLDTQEEMGVFTLFRMQSVSKIFTAIAVMQLVEKGLVDLDAPVSTYIPEFSIKGLDETSGPITVRHLVCHQSGLPREKLKDAEAPEGMQPEDYRTIVGYLKEQYIVYQPGTKTYYSNLGYDLIAVIVENVSGLAFSQYMRNNVLAPAEMPYSDFGLNEDIMDMVTKSYLFDGQKHVPAPLRKIRDIPAGGLFSNVNDMGFFLAAVLNDTKVLEGSLLKKETWDSMFVVQNDQNVLDITDQGGERSGLAWWLTNTNLAYAGRYAEHDGGGATSFTHIKWLPDYKVGVVAMCNTVHPEAAINLEDICDLALINMLSIFHGVEKPEGPPEPAQIPLTPEHILKMSGIYGLGLFGGCTIAPSPDGGALVLSLLSHDMENPVIPVAMVVPNEDGWYALRPLPGQTDANGGIGLPFLRLNVVFDNGKKYLASEEMLYPGAFERKLVGERYVPPPSLSDQWNRRLGLYVSQDSQDLISVAKLDVLNVLGLGNIMVLLVPLDGQMLGLMVEPFDDASIQFFGHGYTGPEKVAFLDQGDATSMSIHGYRLFK